MDLENLNLTELAQLRDSVNAQIASRRVADLDKLRADILSLCNDRGFSLQEVLTSFRKSPAAKVAAPAVSFIKGATYQNPADASQQWFGFGSRPMWLRKYIAGGGDVNKLVVAQPAAQDAPQPAAAKAPAKKPAPAKKR